MSIFRDVSIPFGGADFLVTPSNRLLRMIESKGRKQDPGFNLFEVMIRISSGAALTDAAFILAEFINSAGGQTDEDKALAHMISIDKPGELRALLDLLCACVMPETKEKKPDAPAETP